MAPSLRRSSRRAAASAEVSPAPPAAKRRRRASPSPNPDAKAKAARKTEPEAAREPGDAVPGQDGMVYGFDGAPTSSYEFEREQRMRANAAFLDSLGLGDAKAGLAALAAPAAKKTGPSRRGIKAKREKAKPLPRRKSSRIRGEAADGLQIDTEVAGRVSVSVRAGADPAVAHARAAALKAEVVEAAAPPRVADGPLTLSSTTASEEYGAEFLTTLKRLSAEAEAAGADGADSPVPLGAMAVAERMSKLAIDDEDQVAKVVPDRIYGLAVHPAASALLVAVGDKQGNLGLWNASAGADAEDDGVVNYAPHTRPISRLQYGADGARLYSWSYDGSVRAMDLERESFEHVYKTPESDHGWLQSGCVPARAQNDLWVCDSEGTVKLLDLRRGTGQVAWAKALHEKKINTVEASPAHDHLFATAGLDRVVKLWDKRKLGGGAKKMLLATLPLSRSVNSAYFSCDGEYLLSTSQCNKLNLYHKPYAWAATDKKPTHSVSHDNQTGRWLSTFHAVWHPKQPGVFICGSMQQPRSIEVFHTDNKGRRIMNIQGDYLGSVHSRLAFHPTLDVIAGGNSSGRVSILKEPGTAP